MCARPVRAHIVREHGSGATRFARRAHDGLAVTPPSPPPAPAAAAAAGNHHRCFALYSPVVHLEEGGGKNTGGVFFVSWGGRAGGWERRGEKNIVCVCVCVCYVLTTHPKMDRARRRRSIPRSWKTLVLLLVVVVVVVVVMVPS